MVPIQRLKLKKLNNTRDLGGLPTVDGARIAPGKLIRSGRLSELPAETLDALQTLGVTTVMDLRVAAEFTKHPETLPPGVRYLSLPILAVPGEDPQEERSMRLVAKREGERLRGEFPHFDDYMIATYQSILFEKKWQQCLQTILRVIIEENGCVLWHCNSGKDRTGIVAMLVESLLGVREDAIYADYLATARFCRHRFRLYRAGIALYPGSRRFKQAIVCFLITKKKYLESAIEAVNARYGSVTAYCKAELGVTDEDVARMRQKYLLRDSM